MIRRIFLVLVLCLIVTLGLSYKNNWLPFKKVAPVAEWSKIIIGEWDYKHTYEEKNDKFSLEISGKIHFYNNNTFSLFATADFLGMGNFGQHAQPIGGTVSGKWKIFNDGYIQLNPDTCNIEVPDNLTYIGFNCDYFNNFCYGNCTSRSQETKIDEFSRNEILINGFNFISNAEVTYRLEKSN